MNHVKKIFALMLSLLMLTFMMSGCGDEEDAVVKKDSTAKTKKTKADIKYKIYLITQNQGSNYWQEIDRGCQQAVKEHSGVDYHWIAPAQTNIPEQIECVDKAVANGANAIVISVASPTEINPSLQKAADAGIKLVYVDSVPDFEGIANLITDNEKAGELAAQTLMKGLQEKGITSGTIGIGANLNSKTGMSREKGFRKVFEGSAFTIPPVFEMNGKRENIKHYVKEHPDYVAYFGSNEQISSAIAEQVKESGIHPVILGFDTSDFMLTMIQEGIVYATMQQKPQKMGHDAVEIAIQAIDGSFTERNITRDLGVEVITKDKI